MKLRYTILPACGCAYQHRNSPNTVVQRSLWSFHHVGMTNSISSPRGWKVWLKFQASNRGLIFLVITPNLKLSRGPQSLALSFNIQKDTHSQESTVLGSTGIRNLNQRPNIRTKAASSTPIIQEIRKILGALQKRAGTKIKYISYYTAPQDLRYLLSDPSQKV